MPNWCGNKILVTSEDLYGSGNATVEIKKVIDFIKEDLREFDFNTVIPYPEEYAKMDFEKEDSGYQAGGYQWCINNWGTKWNAVEPMVYIEDLSEGLSCVIRFDTAWSPSIPVTLALSKIFPKLKFEHIYEEGGMDFSGVLFIQDGEVLDEKSGNYGDIRLYDDDYYDGDEDDEGDGE